MFAPTDIAFFPPRILTHVIFGLRNYTCISARHKGTIYATILTREGASIVNIRDYFLSLHYKEVSNLEALSKVATTRTNQGSSSRLRFFK